jgi:adenosylcobinamide-GDP ribazoletransferase
VRPPPGRGPWWDWSWAVWRALATAALWLGLPPGIAAGLALGAGILMTGALHEDGLADCADGFWGGHTAERRLEIMKDSRIGAYGVLALILVIGLKWLALAALIEHGALWAAVLVPACSAGAAMAWVMASLPFAREDGLARHVGRPSKSARGHRRSSSRQRRGRADGPRRGRGHSNAAGVVPSCSRLARAKIGGQTG